MEVALRPFARLSLGLAVIVHAVIRSVSRLHPVKTAEHMEAFAMLKT